MDLDIFRTLSELIFCDNSNGEFDVLLYDPSVQFEIRYLVSCLFMTLFYCCKIRAYTEILIDTVEKLNENQALVAVTKTAYAQFFEDFGLDQRPFNKTMLIRQDKETDRAFENRHGFYKSHAQAGNPSDFEDGKPIYSVALIACEIFNNKKLSTYTPVQRDSWIAQVVVSVLPNFTFTEDFKNMYYHYYEIDPEKPF